MVEERRRSPRVSVKCQINVICTGEVIEGNPKSYIFHTYTQNISEGGINIILEKEIKTGSLIDLELFITDKESLPIKCRGSVVWSKKVNPQGTSPDLFQAGIKFLDLTSSVYRKLLSEVIRYYLNKESEDKK
ncbi:MAG: PilZ domain-containing protein [Candidatus Omnitrophota bacterium]